MSCELVLLPGMDGTGELFKPLVDALGTDVPSRVVRYPDRPLGYAEHESFARSCLPNDRRYVVVGESFSGPIAISLAAAPPRGMLGYVLCASFVCCPRTVLKLVRPLLDVFSPRRVPSALATYFLMGSYATEALRRAQTEVLQSVPPSALSARLKAIAEVDVRGQLRRVHLPGLYMRATKDRMVPRAASRAFAKIATNASVVDIDGPHFLLQTNPIAAASVLRTFVARVDRAV